MRNYCSRKISIFQHGSFISSGALRSLARYIYRPVGYIWYNQTQMHRVGKIQHQQHLSYTRILGNKHSMSLIGTIKTFCGNSKSKLKTNYDRNWINKWTLQLENNNNNIQWASVEMNSYVDCVERRKKPSLLSSMVM